MVDDVAVAQCIVGIHPVNSQLFCEVGAGGIRVHQLQAFQREPAQQRGDGSANHAAAHDGDAVANAGPGIPEGVDSCLDGAGQHGALARDVVGNDRKSGNRNNVAVLVRVEAEHPLTHQRLWPFLDDANREVPVLHGGGEGAFLEGSLHQVGHLGRDAAVVDQRLSASADPGIQCANQCMVGFHRGQGSGAQLAVARPGGPVGLAVLGGGAIHLLIMPCGEDRFPNLLAVFVSRMGK